jgi:hypothetical protein
VRGGDEYDAFSAIRVPTRYGLPAGQPWLEKRLASCRALVVLVCRALGQWQECEIGLGIDRQASRQ